MRRLGEEMVGIWAEERKGEERRGVSKREK
jgi:hypothetical protein